jgi:hypothetical protein
MSEGDRTGAATMFENIAADVRTGERQREIAKAQLASLATA